jgi:DNA polymerase-3 subunit gamma/tau
LPKRLGGVSLTTEQLTRALDVLRQGEDSVKLGLSDKINLEVTLLKAVDASRARAIDSLLRELTQLGAELSASAASPGPGEEKKKP